uniref:BGL06 n=1 Tax=Arundo donax TaxID=35708 RepID=A0A0A9DXT6_ARUDO
MLGVVSGVVVYAHKVQRPLDKGSLIGCELRQSVCNPRPHRLRVIAEEEWIGEPSELKLLCPFGSFNVNGTIRHRFKPHDVEGNPQLAILSRLVFPPVNV